MHTIFYFTGTGNSLKIAKDISENLPDTSIKNMADYCSVKNISVTGVVGFVFPIYFCGIPQLVKNFMTSISFHNTTYAYVVCTYGTAGGNAGAISQSKKILKDKNLSLNAGFYVKSVDNFILLTWDIPDEKKRERIYKNIPQKVKQITSVIVEQQSYFDKSYTEHVFPVLFGHKHFINLVNRADIGFYSTEQCCHCGLCTKVCPTKNIILKDGKPLWTGQSCQGCLSCLHLCPQNCIQYGLFTNKKHRYKNPYITIDEMIY